MDSDKIEDGDDGAGDGKPESLLDEITDSYDQLAEGADAEEGDGKPKADDGSDDGESQEQEAADAEAGEIDDGEQDDAEVIAPEHWSDQDKEAFAALPDEAKPLYLEKVKALESGYNANFEKLANDRKKLEPYTAFNEIFEPYRHELDRQGLTPEGYVRQIMAVAKSLQEDPAAELTRLARVYGVDFGQAQADPAGETEFLDPDMAAFVQQQNQQVNERLGSIESSLNQVTQANTTASTQHMLDTFNAFANEQADGKAVRPHADRLRPQIAAQLNALTPQEQNGKSLTDMLSLAYERAAWADPDARKELIDAQTKPKPKPNGEVKAQVQQAKKAARVPRSKSDGVSQVPDAQSTAGSWREVVTQQMAELEAS